MSTKVEIRKVMFDYEKISEMIVSELDFAVSDDNLPEDEWKEHIRTIINNCLVHYIEKTIEIHHLNNVNVYMSKSNNTLKISGDGSEIYEKPNYYAEEQAFGRNLPDYEEVYIDNEKYTTRDFSGKTILRKIRLGIEENIENEYHNPKKLEKIMKVFYKEIYEARVSETIVEDKIIEILEHNDLNEF